jgi:hypothetical protein
LKAQLGRLVTFFGAIETNINDNAMKDVENFLNSVNRNIKMKGEEVQSIKLRGPTKRVSYFDSVKSVLTRIAASPVFSLNHSRPVFGDRGRLCRLRCYLGQIYSTGDR